MRISTTSSVNSACARCETSPLGNGGIPPHPRSPGRLVAIVAWSDERFGEEARKRYEALIATAIRDAALRGDDTGHTIRPELGDGVFSRHLAQSRARVPGKIVHRPRHFLIYRRDGDVLVIGRILHDAMELGRHVDSP